MNKIATQNRVGARMSAHPGRSRQRKPAMRFTSKYAGLWFVAPSAALLALLVLYPLINGIAVSFFNTNLINRWEFVGVDNFVSALTNARVWSSMLTTAIYTFGVVAGNLVVGISLALLLNTALKARAWFRAILILPWLFPDVVVALVFKWIVNPVYGPLNHILNLLGYGGPPIQWLDTPTGALMSIILASIWKGYPLVMVMVLAGLQSIPQDRYEAAALDGAGKIRSFWHITLPGLRPVLLIVIILETVWYFKQFTIPWVMTAGGPVGATRLVSLDIYQTAFQSFQFGRAAAIAVVVFVLCLVLSSVYRKMIKDDD